MKLKFGSKSQEFAVDGTVTGTKVTLTNDEGAYYPVMLPADKISLSNDELEVWLKMLSIKRISVISTKTRSLLKSQQTLQSTRRTLK